MRKEYENIDPQNKIEDPENFFRKVDIPYSKSKGEIWHSMESRLTEKPSTKSTIVLPGRVIYSLAAVILLLAGVFTLLRFYTTNNYCPPGQHLTCQLPDGSTVELNASSSLSYHPYWWRFNREVKFEGEGFFKVEKGSKFTVLSGSGRTEVLGTSFNIYSRQHEYVVTCITGKVKVVSFNAAEVVLTPEYSASVNESGEISLAKASNANAVHSWVDNMFSFTSRPLALVFDEIGRQYDVRIKLKTPVDFVYTGYFSRNRPLDETLTLVCTPFGLTFARISGNEYEILQN